MNARRLFLTLPLLLLVACGGKSKGLDALDGQWAGRVGDDYYIFSADPAYLLKKVVTQRKSNSKPLPPSF